MTAAMTHTSGEVTRQFAAMPRRTTDECLAIDEAVAAHLTMLADALDDCDSYGILLDAASDIRAKIRATNERNAEAMIAAKWLRKDAEWRVA